MEIGSQTIAALPISITSQHNLNQFRINGR
jgi:hypothetical protein